MLPREDSLKPFNLTRVGLNGTFCFTLVDDPPCINLKHRNITTWMNPLEQAQVSINTLVSALTQITQEQTSGSGIGNNSSGGVNVTTMAIRSTLLVPTASTDLSANGTRFTASPYCKPDSSFPPTFTTCQSRLWEKNQISSGFSLSPLLKRFVIGNDINTTVGDGWP